MQETVITKPPHRVLYVNRVGFLGGVERILVTLASGMTEHGYAPLLACPDGGALAATARAAGVEVVGLAIDRMRATINPVQLSHYAFAMLAGSERLTRLVRERGVDVIHAHHPVGALYAANAARTASIPLLLHVHETLPANLLYRLALTRAVACVDAYICVSTPALDLLRAISPSAAERAHIVSNGVDAIFLDSQPEPAPDVTGPGPHIGVFGVLEPRKAQDVFLRAAEKIAHAHHNARFWIVGPAALKDKGAYVARLHALAEQPTLKGRVCFTGYRSDVGALMRGMDVVALPSVAHESFGMALVEAMVLGTPVVASATGGIGEIVEHGVTGLLAPPGDADQLAQCILRALGAEGIACAQRAALRTRELFAPDTFRSRVAAVYDLMLSSRMRAAVA